MVSADGLMGFAVGVDLDFEEQSFRLCLDALSLSAVFEMMLGDAFGELVRDLFEELSPLAERR